MNILFIMCDQLRWDYLSCYGHPHLQTPHIDSLAKKGVRFTRAYCQAPLCGPSRASFYTGRYMSSHGVMANKDPIKIGELTLGDYLRDANIHSTLIGKSEASPNHKALARLGIGDDTKIGRLVAQDGFEFYEDFAGLYPDPVLPSHLGYNDYLRAKGFAGDNPWELYANSAIDRSGRHVSGWQMRHADKPAIIPEEHSETAFVTNRALEFLDTVSHDQSWCIHLSYIKPHWPYLAPAPYHAVYSEDQVVPAVRHECERQNPHPVYGAFMQQEYSQNFSREEVRRRVIPTYMGLIKQIDDHLGRVFEFLESKQLMHNTMVVFTADHGDYLGDHWLGEKDLFHEPSVRIPLILYDPSSGADATRGTTNDEPVEAIDIVPTLVDYVGGTQNHERMEGRSLLPLIRGTGSVSDWREYVVSEIDYSERGPRTLLNLHPYQCRAYMIRTADWKYVLYEGFRPQLFDLKNDPEEYRDLGADPAFESERRDLHELLFNWIRQRRMRTEIPTDLLFEMGPERDAELGILIGQW
ncbi:MAG: alkaline phosphatase family protein [Arenicellales bacterium]|nr:alkaline phosphatase family protein [Arenicellales bacterium]